MKQFSPSSYAYKRLKRYWKLLQMPMTKLDSSHFRHWVHFKHFMSSALVVEQTLSVDRSLKETYDAYQTFLQDIRQKDPASLKKHLQYYSDRVSDTMKTSINTLLEHFELVENALSSTISNGCLEGINNYIKTLKKLLLVIGAFFTLKTEFLLLKN